MEPLLTCLSSRIVSDEGEDQADIVVETRVTRPQRDDTLW